MHRLLCVWHTPDLLAHGATVTALRGTPRGDRACSWPLVLLGCLLPIAGAVATPVEGQERTWALRERLRIGSIDGADALTLVGRVSVGGGGSLFVSQPLESSIKVFSAEGRLVSTIGGPGAGPGEFQQLTNHGWLGDTLYVSDALANRITFFAATGALLGTLPSRTGSIRASILPSTPTHLNRGGFAIVLPSYRASALMEDPDLARPVLRTSWSGDILDTLALQSLRRSAMTIVSGRSQHFANQPLADHPLVAVSPDAATVAVVGRRVGERASAYSITRIDASSGATKGTTNIDYRPMLVPSNLRDSLLEEAVKGLPKNFGGARDQVRDGLFIPRAFPPATRAGIGTDGRIWVRRETLPGAISVNWDVLSPNGIRIARVVLPVEFDFKESLGDTVIGTVRDGFDVPYVVVYRLLRAAPG